MNYSIRECDVALLGNSVGSLDLVCMAGRRCTMGTTDVLELKKEVGSMSEERKLKYIDKIISSGHMSVLEHIVYNFHIVCSRQCSHQLVRHRLASYSQLSQRYTGLDKLEFIKEAVESIDERYLEEISRVYIEQKELNSSIKNEDSRALLPNCCSTALVVSMNGRELLHFMNERLCSRAQKEIRVVAEKMREVIPDGWLKKYCMPKCIIGGCREFKNGCELGRNLGLVKNDR